MKYKKVTDENKTLKSQTNNQDKLISTQNQNIANFQVTLTELNSSQGFAAPVSEEVQKMQMELERLRTESKNLKARLK